MPRTLAAAVLVLVALAPVAGQQKRAITELALTADHLGIGQSV